MSLIPANMLLLQAGAVGQEPRCISSVLMPLTAAYERTKTADFVINNMFTLRILAR